MSSIESLKEQARRHEQKEEWQKALDQYSKAIDKLAEAEQPDIGLYNRVGDIEVRLGNIEAAVGHYETAIDLYVEAELPNNAIAVCKKVERNMPHRNQVHLKMGQIRAQQGFLVDARQCFLTYAERMQQSGEIDEAFRALVEFADLAPDDTDIRMAIAGQMEHHGRTDEAVEQLRAAYRTLVEKGEEEEARAFEAKIRELDPGADLAAAAPAAVPHDGGLAGFETTALAGEDAGEPVGVSLEQPGAEDEEVEVGGFDIVTGDDDIEPAAGEEEAAEPLPTFGMDDDDEEDEAVEPLPTFAVDDDEDEEDEAAAEPLPTFGMDDDEDEEDEAAAEPLPTFGMDDEEGEDEAVAPLPTFGVDDDEGEDEAAEPLPTFGTDYDEDDEDEAAAEPLPTFGMDDDDVEDEAPEPLPTFGMDDDVEDEAPEPLPTFGMEDGGEEEDEAVEPLPTFEDDDEALRDEADQALEEAAEEAASDELDASAFGVRDFGDREGREYVEDVADLPELEADLDLPDVEAGEPGGEPAEAPPYDPGEAREEAHEEARAERRSEDALGHEALAERGDVEGAMAALERLVEVDPDDVELRQRMVEYAYRTGDNDVLVPAYLELASTLERAGQGGRARAVYQQVLSTDPGNETAKAALGEAGPASQPVREVASSEDYVDLGSMILGDDDEEKSTRFVVAYEEPTGDEEADFARMLSQFKEKVAETFSADDVRSHHDLGTAYKEMGLLDEAISEFQQALRASADHLPTYELLGQTFLDKGEAEAAVRTLSRALDLPCDIEDDRLGIYYYLGRAHEALGNTDSALEFYDRVFSLDINFADVTERLRTLR